MGFGKSTTNFDSPPAEACPNGRRNTEPPKLHVLVISALPPKLAGKCV